MRARGQMVMAAMLVASVCMAQVPTRVSFNARLVDNGAPVQGSRNFVFKLFPSATLGSEVWSESVSLSVTDGNVFTTLGAVTPLTDQIFSVATPLFLEVTVGGTTLTPRTQVVSVPYALHSAVSTRVGTLDEPNIQRRVGSACPPGTAIRVINGDGTVQCQSSQVVDAGAPVITSVSPGAGLIGGGSSGDISLAVSFGGSGSATSVARSDHTHGGVYLPVGSTLSCSASEKVIGLTSGGSVQCASDQNTTYTFASPLNSSGGTVSLSTVPITSGGTNATSAVAARTNLGAAAAGANADITSLSGLSTALSVAQGGTGATSTSTARASLGAAAAGPNGDITSLSGLSTALSVSQGGTGATSTATARASLGAAAAGANGDITSLSGLSTALSAGQGGTGLTSAGASGNFLRSGGGAWASAPISVGDLPSLAGQYVQNQFGAAQTASFNIIGQARVAGQQTAGSGTLSWAASDLIVNGSGTSFSSQVQAGDVLGFVGGSSCGSVNDARPVGRVISNTQLELIEPLTSASAACTFVIYKPLLSLQPPSGAPFSTSSLVVDASSSLHVPWAFRLFHSDPAFGVNSKRVRMRWNWSGYGLADYVYLGSTGSQSNSGQMAMVMGSGFGGTYPNSGGVSFGRGADTGDGLASTMMTLNPQGNLGIGNYTQNLGGTQQLVDRLTVQGDVRVGTVGTNGCLKNFGGGVITGTCSSDARLKKNIAPAAPALEALARLRVVNFDWRADEYPAEHFGTQRELGIIAQEVEQVMPQLVSTDEKGFKRVHFEAMPMLLLQAAQELRQRDSAQDRRVKALEAENREMKARLERLERALGKAGTGKR